MSTLFVILLIVFALLLVFGLISLFSNKRKDSNASSDIADTIEDIFDIFN
jgi:hypothetical protein